MKECKNWVVILLLIVFFPVGLYLMWAKTNWSKVVKIIVTVFIGFVFLCALASNGSESGNIEAQPTNTEATTIAEETTEPATVEQTTAEPTTIEPTTKKVEPATNAVSLGKQNALNKANDYLSIMAFSEIGLKEQLEYDKFTSEEADYAVKNCGADWNEQAGKKAKEYLDLMSFSKQELIDQLKYDGFTQSQAEYGVTVAGY